MPDFVLPGKLASHSIKDDQRYFHSEVVLFGIGLKALGFAVILVVFVYVAYKFINVRCLKNSK